MVHPGHRDEGVVFQPMHRAEHPLNGYGKRSAQKWKGPNCSCQQYYLMKRIIVNTMDSQQRSRMKVNPEKII
jgi:hypothetical protein